MASSSPPPAADGDEKMNIDNDNVRDDAPTSDGSSFKPTTQEPPDFTRPTMPRRSTQNIAHSRSQSADEETFEPMAKSTSAQDTSSSPYGTRSRSSRTATTNVKSYAESPDDADAMEFEMANKRASPPTSNAPNIRETRRRSSTTALAAQNAANATNGDASLAAVSNSASNSAAAAAAPAANSKKRKLPAPSAATASPNSPAHISAAAQQQIRDSVAEAIPRSDLSEPLLAGTRRQRTIAAAAATRTNDGVTEPAPITGRRGPGTKAPSGSSVAQSLASRRAEETGSTMMFFEKSREMLDKNGILWSDDGVGLAVNDHVYTICEPPGEPYYLGRIMEFLHKDSDPKQKVEYMRLNWFYRPKDAMKKSPDTRMLYATMQNDVQSLHQLRGKCVIRHKSQVADIDEFRTHPDHFWYDQLFHRYFSKFYDVIPTSEIRNMPQKDLDVLTDKWKYVVVEMGHGKTLTTESLTCRRCSGFCANADSVVCAVCKSAYHMACVRPALTKKPSRGFAWACGPCSRARERKLEARNTPNVSGVDTESVDEFYDEEEEEEKSPVGIETAQTSRNNTSGRSGTLRNTPVGDEPKVPTAEQLANADLWEFRYFGIHCKPEDIHDYDNTIHPRASSRLGTKHQAVVPPWPGQPVEYVVTNKRLSPWELKKKSHQKGAGKRAQEEEMARKERESRPPWMQDAPPGYIERGISDETSQPLFIPPDAEDENYDEAVFNLDYLMRKAPEMGPSIGIRKNSTNLLDMALRLYKPNDHNGQKTLERLKKMDKHKDLKEPKLTAAEVQRFEDAISKEGDELGQVTRAVRTVPYGDIVRFYYMWKKTPSGEKIWGNNDHRRHAKKVQEESGHHNLADDVADDADDSAFDADKATRTKKLFECRFCNTRKSRFWRRAPGVQAGSVVYEGGKKGNVVVPALCLRCAKLWRKYHIQWEPFDETRKKVSVGGGRNAKRRNIDQEVLKEYYEHEEQLERDKAAAATNGTPAGSAVATKNGSLNGTPAAEPPKKKIKLEEEPVLVKKSHKKKLPVEKPVVAPVPKVVRLDPCAVCLQIEPRPQHMVCRECGLSVHKACYGITEWRGMNRWICDMCANDKELSANFIYDCSLCFIHFDEFREPDDDGNARLQKHWEKCRRQNTLHPVANDVPAHHRIGSINSTVKDRPTHPREALKLTDNKKWAHIVCSLFIPEIKYSDADALTDAEGFQLIPASRRMEKCAVCDNNGRPTTECHQCHLKVHPRCAQYAGFKMGFDIKPIKSSRRDNEYIVKLGEEQGLMTPVILCREHAVKTIVHPLGEVDSTTQATAIQLYARTYKQVDTTNTPALRKSLYIEAGLSHVHLDTPKNETAAGASNHHRASIYNVAHTSARRASLNLPPPMATRRATLNASQDGPALKQEDGNVSPTDTTMVNGLTNGTTHALSPTVARVASPDSYDMEQACCQCGNKLAIKFKSPVFPYELQQLIPDLPTDPVPSKVQHNYSQYRHILETADPKLYDLYKRIVDDDAAVQCDTCWRNAYHRKPSKRLSPTDPKGPKPKSADADTPKGNTPLSNGTTLPYKIPQHPLIYTTPPPQQPTSMLPQVVNGYPTAPQMAPLLPSGIPGQHPVPTYQAAPPPHALDQTPGGPSYAGAPLRQAPYGVDPATSPYYSHHPGPPYRPMYISSVPVGPPPPSLARPVAPPPLPNYIPATVASPPRPPPPNPPPPPHPSRASMPPQYSPPPLPPHPLLNATPPTAHAHIVPQSPHSARASADPALASPRTETGHRRMSSSSGVTPGTPGAASTSMSLTNILH